MEPSNACGHEGGACVRLGSSGKRGDNYSIKQVSVDLSGQSLERLFEEIKVLKQLSFHRNLMTFHDWW